MADILIRERDLGENNSLGVKLQYFLALVCILGCKMSLISGCWGFFIFLVPIATI